MGMFNKELTIKEGTNDRFKMEISFSSVFGFGLGLNLYLCRFFFLSLLNKLLLFLNFCGILNFKFFFSFSQIYILILGINQ